MKRIITLVITVFVTLNLFGCGTGAVSSGESQEENNLSVVEFQVDDSYRQAGRSYWQNFAENPNSSRYDLSNLYKFTGDQIPGALIGEWQALNDYGHMADFSFKENGVVDWQGKDKNWSNSYHGTWKVLEEDDRFIKIDFEGETTYSGLYYVCALQDDDHLLIFGRWADERKSYNRANPYLMERK